MPETAHSPSVLFVSPRSCCVSSPFNKTSCALRSLVSVPAPPSHLRSPPLVDYSPSFISISIVFFVQRGHLLLSLLDAPALVIFIFFLSFALSSFALSIKGSCHSVRLRKKGEDHLLTPFDASNLLLRRRSRKPSGEPYFAIFDARKIDASALHSPASDRLGPTVHSLPNRQWHRRRIRLFINHLLISGVNHRYTILDNTSISPKMKSTFFLAASVLAAVDAASPSHHQAHKARAEIVPKPSVLPKKDALASQGCYSSVGNMTEMDPVENLSTGSCGALCQEKEYYVAALSPGSCYCGYMYPPKDTYTDIDDCNYPCPYYDKEACGSINGDYSIFNTGKKLAVEYYSESSSSSTSAASSTSTGGKSTSTGSDTTVVTETEVAQSSGSSEDDGDKKGGTNTAAIAAGVVVGVVAAAAIIGGVIFYMRRKRNAEIEEEHRRNAAVNAFISGSKPPSTSGGVSITDSRLDPVMAHRRLSDGSIADNQDYSRKILRVSQRSCCLIISHSNSILQVTNA